VVLYCNIGNYVLANQVYYKKYLVIRNKLNLDREEGFVFLERTNTYYYYNEFTTIQLKTEGRFLIAEI
jgi:hypothetical protein